MSDREPVRVITEVDSDGRLTSVKVKGRKRVFASLQRKAGDQHWSGKPLGRMTGAESVELAMAMRGFQTMGGVIVVLVAGATITFSSTLGRDTGTVKDSNSRWVGIFDKLIAPIIFKSLVTAGVEETRKARS